MDYINELAHNALAHTTDIPFEKYSSYLAAFQTSQYGVQRYTLNIEFVVCNNLRPRLDKDAHFVLEDSSVCHSALGCVESSAITSESNDVCSPSQEASPTN
jgi:hypothetical protein